ncbi:hypothetical protein AK812_SmicGene12842 [Symbiodinium microadriaticum]|uniref:Uncharacterized protein n=1 Tax=Symbiodinium microadriaticum TaxID=2951 RepID=A0A1Q9E9N6_SYMMI|nr:hypothetical protein AK812_SmicGene12842 [Symbiodinium microadriaticum]
MEGLSSGGSTKMEKAEQVEEWVSTHTLDKLKVPTLSSTLAAASCADVEGSTDYWGRGGAQRAGTHHNQDEDDGDTDDDYDDEDDDADDDDGGGGSGDQRHHDQRRSRARHESQVMQSRSLFHRVPALVPPHSSSTVLSAIIIYYTYVEYTAEDMAMLQSAADAMQEQHQQLDNLMAALQRTSPLGSHNGCFGLYPGIYCDWLWLFS